MKLSRIAYEIQKENSEQPQDQPDSLNPVYAPKNVEKNTLTKDQKKKLAILVNNYNKYSELLSPKTKMMDIANALEEIARLSNTYISGQQGEWFEKNIVKRNLADLNKRIDIFSKLAAKIDSSTVELYSLYDEAGKILEKYFTIE